MFEVQIDSIKINGVDQPEAVVRLKHHAGDTTIHHMGPGEQRLTVEPKLEHALSHLHKKGVINHPGAESMSPHPEGRGMHAVEVESVTLNGVAQPDAIVGVKLHMGNGWQLRHLEVSSKTGVTNHTLHIHPSDQKIIDHLASKGVIEHKVVMS